MNKLLASVLLLVPNVASAHEGPAHVHGDDPHLLLAAACFAAVAVAVAVLRKLAVRS